MHFFCLGSVSTFKPQNEFLSQKIFGTHGERVHSRPVESTAPKTRSVQLSTDHLFNVVLIEPEIAANTGNIGRTCVGMNAKLHLVGTLGFSITDRRLKRAGLDYWPYLDFVHHAHWDDWRKQIPDPARVFFMSTKAEKSLYTPTFQRGDWFVFGRETKGLDPEILKNFSTQALKIPMLGPIRSLNIATAVAIVLFEGYRQVDFKAPFRLS